MVLIISIIMHMNLCSINLCFIATALFQAEAFAPSASSVLIPRRSYSNCKCKQTQTQLTSSRRRDVLITITTSSLISFLPPIQPVLAKDESMNYQAVWYDPKHPNGYRVLYGDNRNAKLIQKDEPSDEEVAYPVKVIQPEGGHEGKETKLIFEFNENGTVEGTLTRNREGTRIISFDNGQQSMWINKKFEGPIGVYRDSTDPKRVIIIRQVKGSDCVVEVRDGGGNITSSFPAKAGTTFTFNFPNGKVTASFDMKRRSFTFDDGTVWTKY